MPTAGTGIRPVREPVSHHCTGPSGVARVGSEWRRCPPPPRASRTPFAVAAGAPRHKVCHSQCCSAGGEAHRLVHCSRGECQQGWLGETGCCRQVLSPMPLQRDPHSQLAHTHIQLLHLM